MTRLAQCQTRILTPKRTNGRTLEEWSDLKSGMRGFETVVHISVCLFFCVEHGASLWHHLRSRQQDDCWKPLWVKGQGNEKNNMYLALFSMPALCADMSFFFPRPGEMDCVSVLFYITWNISSLTFFHRSLTWHSLKHSDISRLHKWHREKMAYLLRLGFLPTGQSPALWKAAVPSDRKITGSGWVTD